jgi:hypothetical protein
MDLPPFIAIIGICMALENINHNKVDVNIKAGYGNPGVSI